MRTLLLVGIFCAVQLVRSQSACDGGSCYPDIGDLLVGREKNVTATSTCGVDRPEKYCIVSHLKDNEKCFFCDAGNPARNHEVENVITTFNNRLETWWQSENGMDKVSLRLDLETSFHFTHLIMTFKTFRPAAMLIERSNDFGRTWNIYRYFAVDCEEFWPGVPEWPPRHIDQIICDDRYSLIEPSTEGEVIYKVLEPSLIPYVDAYSDEIQNLLTITNLRINFTEMHTLGDNLLDHRANIKEKYYYSLYELIVRGNCFCYGHADECRPIDPSLERPDLARRRILQVNGKCVCEHNTMGLNCDQCLPFYQDHPWRPARRGQPNECKLCECYGHSTSCHFDEAVYEASGRVSGGVCEDCQHNTAGQHCELCLPGYYPNPDLALNDPRRCEPCNCNVAGSLNNGLCLQEDDPATGVTAGDCVCKDFVEGQTCDRCKPGFYDLSEDNRFGCTLCDCDSLGTLSGSDTCDSETGQCICKRFTTGRRCDQCLPETWGMSADGSGCRECYCDVGGSYDNDCNERSGQCNCRPNINLRRCNDSISGYFLPDLDFYVFEAEDATGERTFLYKQKFDPNAMWTGYGFRMVRADGTLIFIVNGLPASMEYDFILRYSPYTKETTYGVEVEIERPTTIVPGSVCDNTKPSDDKWVASLEGYPISNKNLGTHCLEMQYTYKVIFKFPGKMDDINVDSLVLVPQYSGISMFHGSQEGEQRAREFQELTCQEEALILPPVDQNEICNGLVFSMSAIIHDGSLPCDCDPQGSLSSICDKMGGQCICKTNVMGRRCDKCVPGTYGLGPDGCRACDCDSQGALQPEIQYCDPSGGQCRCRHSGITGRKCDRCKAGYYKFPDCLACQCNGHSDYCDQNTGVCIDCREHTTGENCQDCEDGYYGNPLLGSGDQCKPCMCPGGPDSGRQFAVTCRETINSATFQRQVVCNCLTGYAGETCGQCAPSYYGNPQEIGGYCTACECNGNVDVRDPNACDANTGVCTGCLYDTAGPHCEQCRDFYYGDALLRECRACQCDVRGTVSTRCVGGQCHCDQSNGQCPCLPNMTGRRCESCLPNHYRGEEGEGCKSCNCHPYNSFSETCNEFTGQCQCKDGFGGLTCSDCAAGYWGDPPRACRECNCDPLGSKSSQCHPRTGVCECHDGVGGSLCDRCHRGFTGQVPYCEACGECFDDWDAIISDLKIRTDAVIARAKEIQDTGITGAYEDEFKIIEKMLDDLRNRQPGGPEYDDPSGFQDAVDKLKTDIEAAEQRLKDLEDEMSRIQADNDQVNDGLTSADEAIADIQSQLDELNEKKDGISKASPAAAYKRVEDAADMSEKAQLAAEAATTEPGSLVEQSADARAQVEEIFADKLLEFEDKYTQVEMDLEGVKQEVDNLSVAELNADVCGKATEDCDETCGGALCESGCGGLGCNGAVTNANVAKDRAQKTKDILDQLTEDAADFQNRLQIAKENAEDAKSAAEVAKKQADEVESRVRERNENIRDLISRIRKFLGQNRATPEQIEELALMVLDLSLKAGRQEIDDLAANIRSLVDRLPDVDRILNDTQEDLDRANALKEAADQAQRDAANVANDANAVVKALDEAENASKLAEAAKTEALANIDIAQAKINDISQSAGAVMTQVEAMQTSLNELDEQLKAVENKINANKLEADEALQQANFAKETADMAKLMMDNEGDLINQANATINAKKAQVDRLKTLRENAEELSKSVSDNLNRLNDLSDQFQENEIALNEKSSELDGLLEKANELYKLIAQKEKDMRVCP